LYFIICQTINSLAQQSIDAANDISTRPHTPTPFDNEIPSQSSSIHTTTTHQSIVPSSDHDPTTSVSQTHNDSSVGTPIASQPSETTTPPSEAATRQAVNASTSNTYHGGMNYTCKYTPNH
jgi:hypothetical protein